jgi:hypothetical protein
MRAWTGLAKVGESVQHKQASRACQHRGVAIETFITLAGLRLLVSFGRQPTLDTASCRAAGAALVHCRAVAAAAVSDHHSWHLWQSQQSRWQHATPAIGSSTNLSAWRQERVRCWFLRGASSFTKSGSASSFTQCPVTDPCFIGEILS